ncbi:RNA polymerase sigma factor, partial [Photobacterium kishitanii]
VNLEIDFNKIIPRLSINEQEIINLRFYKDFSLNEISNILQITISACKMRLYRALQSLSILII